LNENKKIINISYWITVILELSMAHTMKRGKSLDGFKFILNEILIKLMHKKEMSMHIIGKELTLITSFCLDIET